MSRIASPPTTEAIDAARPGDAAVTRDIPARIDGLAILACATIGLALAVLPHVATLWRDGVPEYIADNDDLYYLAMARAPYHGEATVRDPFTRDVDGVPTPYSWMQFVPGSKLAAALGVPPHHMNLLYRLLGGAAMGVGAYAAFRRILAGSGRPVAWALGCTVIFLADIGTVHGRSLADQVPVLFRMLGLTPSPSKLTGLNLYRVVSPLLNLPFLLMLVAVLTPPVRNRARAALLGAMLLGLLIHLYFYTWTATVVALGAMLTISAFGLLVGGRWRPEPGRIGVLGAVLVGGLLLGAPQVIANQRTFSDPTYRESLARLSKGRPVPPGDPERTEFLVQVWLLGKLAAGGLAIYFLGMPTLIFPWWLALAGYALNNSALLTGLDFENNHWKYISNPLSEMLLLGAVALAIERLGALRPVMGRRLGLGSIAVAVVTLAIGGGWQAYAALRSTEAVRLSQLLREQRPLRPALAQLDPARVLAGPFESNPALIFSRVGHLYARPYSSHASLIPDDEVFRRHALSAWLRGLDLDAYLAESEGEPFEIGGRSDLDRHPETLRRRRAEEFRRIAEGEAEPLLERYGVGYLLIPTADGTPTRGGPWRQLDGTAEWTLWERAEGR